ncbi:LOW QUALITY PROTEIN: uncharacterized protein LOC128337304 [Hemicordylus capensis]|uniref:LOW QUALITY PROTEIN: uncharacterized protein LOC128337304 n=1 Tax=Hemicordylus capensis TaxID=884348 RepID=UPI0023039803|nr:LOW QUALITY PROTEIN: uncharacterized protein LOC128337304 [Hemicordylus capensis]
MQRLTENLQTAKVQMIFMEQANLDLRSYNAPSSHTEVAAIFVGEDGEPPSNRDICIYPTGETCQIISPMNCNTDPMVYPLLFPHGECGWHIGMSHVEERRSAKRVKVTQLRYFAYRLATWRSFSLLHSSGKLYQQYIVDAYVRTEGSRLNYLRQNQQDLRIEQYRGLLDALETHAKNEHLKTGKMIILPSTFQGSPRYMQQNYQDAMAIIRRFGHPDLFITFTCNPAWPEISQAMQGTQRPEHRPDIIVRVFKMKLTSLLDDILKHQFFGQVIAYIYVIEFQKQGLPHAHVLLTLQTKNKIRTKDDIDRYVHAEIPSKNVSPKLYEIVTKHMIHGPCGTLNPHAPCMKDGTCSKNFPKDLRNSTEENVNGYPLYRRQTSAPVRLGKYDVDNCWVVPYNPWILKKHNAHINVEVCASVKSVKYLYKYVYKGHDATSIKLQQENQTGILEHDEITTFLDGRYVSAPEAMWHINEFTLTEKSHTIIRLPVHLPEHQQLVYHEGQEEQAIAMASIKKTMLTAWFTLDHEDQEANKLTYADIPKYYVFDKIHTKWKRRQRRGEGVIGRMPVVSIKDSERYYLRMLLTRTKGSTGFDSLRTVHGVLYDSYLETCRAHGLLEGDKNWHETLTEAEQSQMLHSLRMLFAIIGAFGEAEDVAELWNQHKHAMCEDLVRKYSESTDPQYALAEIETQLKTYGMTLKNMNLPVLHLPDAILKQDTIDILGEQEQAKIHTSQLNIEQQRAVTTVLQAIYDIPNDKPHCFFLDGPAGTGKTFVYTTLIHTIRSKGDQATAVASTGIAATLLPGGRTAHSVFKIPLILDASSTCDIKPNTIAAKHLIDTKLIVWDEAPMTQTHAFLAVVRLLKDLTKSTQPFRGKTILLGGDFRQILPVIIRGSRSLTVASCLKKHHLWKHIHVIKLNKNMRALHNEKDFATWLHTTPTKRKSNTDCDKPHVNNRVLNNHVNNRVLELSNRVLECMPGEEVIYASIDTIESEQEEDRLAYPEEFLNSLTPTGMPPHQLRLKPGAIIMLLRNLAPTKRLCNGTRLTVIRLQPNIIEAKPITHSENNEIALISRIPIIPSDTNMPFKFKRRQFPVRLSFVMTINKSQGQTFDRICLYLKDPVFSHGQLYVALSRVRSFDSLTIVSAQQDIPNCVYTEIFDNNQEETDKETQNSRTTKHTDSFGPGTKK